MMASVSNYVLWLQSSLFKEVGYLPTKVPKV